MVLATRIESLSVGAAGVVVRFGDGCAVDAATEWIRDACRCSACRDPKTGQHLHDVSELGGWEVVHAVVVDDGLVIDLERSTEAHRVRVRGTTVRRLEAPAGPIRCTWTGLHRDELVDASRVVPVAQRVHELATDLIRYGIAVGTQLEPVDRAVLKLAHALGFVRESSDGEIFDLRTSTSAADVGCTTRSPSLHTDAPYRDPKPSVQILHCLRPAPVGGVARFVDGFAAAEQLRSIDPDAFSCLVQTPVEFRHSSADTDLRARQCILETDSAKVVRAVHLDHQHMEAPQISGAAARRFYAAYRRLRAIANEPANILELPFGLGDVMMFDTRRVLHGRAGNPRSDPLHVQGCHIDIDAVESLARVNERTRSRPQFFAQQLF